MNAADELVDVLDEQGVAVGVATRGEVRAGNLWHRSVFVTVVADAAGPGPTGAPAADHVATHRRADWKDVWPGRWDLAFGGVVDAGEDWADAARRELAEEAGIDGVDLVELGEGHYEDDATREHARVWLARHAGPLTCPDGEVAELRWVPLADLDRFLADHDVVPDTAALVLPHLRARHDGAAG